MFDVEMLFEVVERAVAAFGETHADQTFYAFAIDANMLCLNSEEDFAATLARYQVKYPDHYRTSKAIEELRYNTGDWKHQGFFCLKGEHGFDRSAYTDHYYEAGDSEDGTAPHTAYAKAMTALVERLQASTVFDHLKRAENFRICWVDHTY